MCLSLIVLFLRQEKYCIRGILSNCSREGNSEIQSSAMLPVTAISPKLQQITPSGNMAQCKCETKHEKKGGKKRKKKEEEGKKEKKSKKRERKKKRHFKLLILIYLVSFIICLHISSHLPLSHYKAAKLAEHLC